MAVVTLAELRTRVRVLADLEDDSEFVDDLELKGHINRSLWALDDLLHKTWADYFVVEFPTAFSGTSYPLPEDFYKLVAVDVRRTDSTWTDLKPYMLAERNTLRNLTTPVTVDAVKYRILGAELKFLPAMPANTQAILTYYPQMGALVNDADTRDYPNGWEQWACLQTAVILLTKEERDTSALEMLLARETARIEASAPIRDEAPVAFVESNDVGGVALNADGISRWRR
jgi:hypothetical protein